MSEFLRSWAVVIGINNYNHGIPTLRNAVNDARQLNELLRKQYGYQSWVFLDEHATLENLETLLETTLLENVQQDDRLLFYFAGHGMIECRDDGSVGYLIPQDAKRGNVDTYLPMTQVQAALEKLPCRHFLGILDCCFGGAFRWGSMRDLLAAPEVIYQERYDRFIQDPAWQIIASAGSDQRALDSFGLDTERGLGEHSPFAAALLEGLSGDADYAMPGKQTGDGIITATELYLYLRDRVEPTTESLKHRQTPISWQLRNHDKGEYIFGQPLNLPRAPELDTSSNPYRGLESYSEEHSDLFFGRTKLVEELQKFVERNSLTVVLGASGSGKSSLVQAGLIPKLKQETTEQWVVVPSIRPGKTPLQALNQGLRTAQLPEIEIKNPQQDLSQIITVWAAQNPKVRLLLFIDQSEEIITLCQDENDRREFFRQILKAIATHWDKLRVVLSLRSDFEPQLRDAGLQYVPTELKLGNTDLKNHWHNGRFNVPMMTRDELREAIEKPAEKQVMNFQPHKLVDQLIDEVANMPGALPLLSFALSGLYLKYLDRQRDAQLRGITIDRSLTESDYRALGGVIESLTQKADQKYDELVKEDPAYAQIIRHVMLRMVALGGGELARRQVPFSELEYPPGKHDLVKEVIDLFTKARLLVTGEDTEGNYYVEPAHDALVRGWAKLLGWVKEEKNLKLQRRLTPAALEWKSKQQKQFLWNADPYLEVLEKEVLNSENNWLNQVETEFVQRSVETKGFHAKRNWGIGIAILLGSMGLTIAAMIGQRNAEVSQIRALINSSDARFTAGQEFDALLDSLRATQKLKAVFPPVFDSTIQDQNNQFLQQAVSGVREFTRLDGDDKPISEGYDGQISWSPDGQVLAFASGEQTVKLWRQDGTPPKILRGFNTSVRGVSWSSNGKMLATVSHDGWVKLWNPNGNLLKEFKVNGNPYGINWINDELLAMPCSNATIQLSKTDGTALPPLKSEDRQVIFSASWNSQGQMLASSGADGNVRLWKPDGTKLRPPDKDRGWVWGISWHPDGQILATTGSDRIRLLRSDLTEITAVAAKGIQRLSWSPDKQTLATAGGLDGTVKLWKWNEKDKTLLPTLTLRTPTPIASLKWSPDGTTLATLNLGDGTVRLWKKDNSVLTTLYDHSGGVNDAQFSPDGQVLATAGDDTTVKLFQRDGTSFKLFKSLQFPNNNIVSPIKSLSWSPNGKTLAVGDKNSVHLLKRDGRRLDLFKGHDNFIYGLSWNPDGQILASSAGDNTVKLWKQGGSSNNLGGFGDWVYGLSWSPDGQILAVGVKNGSVFLRKQDGTLIKPLDKAQNNEVSWNPNGLLTTSGGNTIKLWDRDGKLLKSIPAESDGVERIRIAWSPDGKILAATSRYTIKLLKLEGKSLTLLTTLKGHTDIVKSIGWSSDGRLVSTSADGTVKLWRLDQKSLYNQSLDSLLKTGCDWMRNYLKNNPNVSERDRRLCDN